MDFEVKKREPQKQRSDCIVVAVFEGKHFIPSDARRSASRSAEYTAESVNSLTGIYSEMELCSRRSR